MQCYYTDLAKSVNDYIDIQTQRHGVISIVLFDSDAKIHYQGKTDHLLSRDVKDSFGGGTNFKRAELQELVQERCEWT
jgi:hypothetical protein